MAEFSYSNSDREMEAYGYDSVVKSHCRMCHGGCGVLIYLKDGRVAKIAGDPDCPINHGTLCTKGLASAQVAYHPDRLTYPVRRIGPKASGKWERISWDITWESLDRLKIVFNTYDYELRPNPCCDDTLMEVKKPRRVFNLLMTYDYDKGTFIETPCSDVPIRKWKT